MLELLGNGLIVYSCPMISRLYRFCLIKLHDYQNVEWPECHRMSRLPSCGDAYGLTGLYDLQYSKGPPSRRWMCSCIALVKSVRKLRFDYMLNPMAWTSVVRLQPASMMESGYDYCCAQGQALGWDIVLHNPRMRSRWRLDGIGNRGGGGYGRVPSNRSPVTPQSEAHKPHQARIDEELSSSCLTLQSISAHWAEVA